MKTLIIYYSLEGNTRFIAENIQKTLNADILELKPKKDISSKNFMKYLWGGKMVMMKEKPELAPYDKNPQDYEMIFLGTPVWAFNHSPAIYSFLSNTKFSGKKIALFCTHEGNPGKTFDNMKKMLNGNEILGQEEFIKPLLNKDTAIQKIQNWVKKINLQ